MATSIQPVATGTFSDDATFRAWGKALSDGLAAVGLVKTADAGQINWATAVRPSAAGTIAGYEVWRFNDALQATAPVFLKIEYGVATAVTRSRTLWTIGKGSDGNGNVTGLLAGRQQVDRSSDIAYPVQHELCFNDGGLAVAVQASQSGGSESSVAVMVIERVRGANGDPDAEGLLAFVGNLGTNSAYWCGAMDGAWSDGGGLVTNWAATLPPFLGPSAPNSSNYKGETPLFPCYPVLGWARLPSRKIAIASNPDIGFQQTVTVDLGAEQRKFRGSIGSIGSSSLTRGGSTTWRACIGWE